MSLKTMLASLLVVMMGTTANAQIETTAGNETGYAGVLLGFADPTNLDGRFAYGVDVGLRFANGLTGLIFFRNGEGKEDGVENTVMHYGVGADYSLAGMFGGLLSGFHGGLRLGMGSLEVEGGGDSETDFSAGLGIGYDYVINYGISVGGSADWLYTFGDDEYATIYLMGNVKYWF